MAASPIGSSRSAPETPARTTRARATRGRVRFGRCSTIHRGDHVRTVALSRATRRHQSRVFAEAIPDQLAKLCRSLNDTAMQSLDVDRVVLFFSTDRLDIELTQASDQAVDRLLRIERKLA